MKDGRAWDHRENGFKGTEKRVTKNQTAKVQKAGQRALELNSDFTFWGE